MRSDEARAKDREYYAKTRERRAELNKKRYEANKDWFYQNGKKWKLKKRYSMTPEDLSKMMEDQKGLCFLCEEKPLKYLNVDHCHTTGKVRGLLCGNCNRGLGLFKDNPNVLAKAIKYLGGSD